MWFEHMRTHTPAKLIRGNLKTPEVEGTQSLSDESELEPGSPQGELKALWMSRTWTLYTGLIRNRESSNKVSAIGLVKYKDASSQGGGTSDEITD